MKRFNFPWIAAGIGIILAIVMLRGGATEPAGATHLPPLTLLFISEFGFLITATGAFVAVRAWRRAHNRRELLLGLACSVLALGFVAIGIAMWRIHVAT